LCDPGCHDSVIRDRPKTVTTKAHDLDATGSPETPSTNPLTITGHEAQQVERANATRLQPVVFVHGLWLLPSSWDRWASLFKEAGYTALNRGHALTVDSGWREVADTALAFIRRFV
jgi:pimeloyl-ACP methyl ester carboxylesterase